jgi:hypothetical protein
MGNAAFAEELASTDELEELYQLDGSESEPDDDDADGDEDSDGNEDSDGDEGGGEEIHPEGMPVE